MQPVSRDAWQVVLSHVPKEELTKCALVCREWRKIVEILLQKEKIRGALANKVYRKYTAPCEFPFVPIPRSPEGGYRVVFKEGYFYKFERKLEAGACQSPAPLWGVHDGVLYLADLQKVRAIDLKHESLLWERSADHQVDFLDVRDSFVAVASKEKGCTVFNRKWGQVQKTFEPSSTSIISTMRIDEHVCWTATAQGLIDVHPLNEAEEFVLYAGLKNPRQPGFVNMTPLNGDLMVQSQENYFLFDFTQRFSDQAEVFSKRVLSAPLEGRIRKIPEKPLP